MPFFGNEKGFSVETYDVPKTVEAAVDAIWRGSPLMTPIGGGVQIQAKEALDYDNVKTDEKGKISKLRESVKPDLGKDQWWWD